MRLTKPKIALFAALLFLSLALVLPPTREGAKLLVNDLFALSESVNAYVYEAVKRRMEQEQTTAETADPGVE